MTTIPPFDKLLASPTYKAMKPDQRLDAMLRFKTFEQLLADGDLFDVQGASQRSGYTPQHVRRLCREERLDHLVRGLPSKTDEVHMYFLPDQLAALFSYRKARA